MVMYHLSPSFVPAVDILMKATQQRKYDDLYLYSPGPSVKKTSQANNIPLGAHLCCKQISQLVPQPNPTS